MKYKKKIAVVYSANDSYGGIYTFWRDIVNGMNEDIDFTFFSTIEPLKKTGFKYVYKKSFWAKLLCKINLQDSLSGLIALKYIKDLETFDTVIFNQPNAWPIAKYLKKPKKINILHGTAKACSDAWKGVNWKGYLLFKFKEIFERKGANDCDKILTVSEFSKLNLKKEGILKPIINCGWGVDLNRFKIKINKSKIRKRFNFKKEDFIMLFVGRWSLGKGSDIITSIMKDLSKKYDDIKMICVAKPPKNWKILNKYNIYFLENINDNELPLIYKSSDLFFFPTRYEGFGSVTAEAAASGLPIITTATGWPWMLKKNKILKKYILPVNANIKIFEKIILKLSKNKKEIKRISTEYFKNNTYFDINNTILNIKKEILKNENTRNK